MQGGAGTSARVRKSENGRFTPVGTPSGDPILPYDKDGQERVNARPPS